jgi:ribosomal-protein-alanine N-acetyltransferase
MPEDLDWSAPAISILDTPRLLLRTWTRADEEAARAIYGNAEVMRFLGNGLPVTNPAEVRDRLIRRMDHQRRHGFTLWAVEEKATGHVVGACGLKLLEDVGPEVEVGYHFAREAWGKGYATEAAAACLRLGFDRLRLARIVGVVDPANFASQRVLEKIGLIYEGRGWHYNRELLRYAAMRP